LFSLLTFYYLNSRLRDRLTELEARSQAEIARAASLEKEAQAHQEALYKRDRTIREERQRAEDAVGRLEELRTRYETEVESFRTQLHEEKNTNSELIRRHKLELEELRREISEKVPRIAAAAVESVENQMTVRVEKEVSSVKLRYEQQLEIAKRDLYEAQAEIAEKEARGRFSRAEEKAELDKLRYQHQRLQRRADEIEVSQYTIAFLIMIFLSFIPLEF
jgi:hypothetical protein